MSILQFFTNLSQLLVSIEIPAGTIILIALGLAGGARWLSWRHVGESALFVALAFAAANVVNTIYG